MSEPLHIEFGPDRVVFHRDGYKESLTMTRDEFLLVIENAEYWIRPRSGWIVVDTSRDLDEQVSACLNYGTVRGNVPVVDVEATA